MGLEAGEQEPQKRQGGIKLTGPTLADHIEKSTFSEDYRAFTTHSSRNRNAGLSRASPLSLHAAMNFTPSQRNAINHTPDSLKPIVCAGYGKMEVVGPAHGHAHNADQHSQPDQRQLGALVTVLAWLRFFRLDLQN
jgi:hypothetical protein